MAIYQAANQIDDTIPIAGSGRTYFKFGEYDHSTVPLEKDEIPVMIIGSSMVGMFMGLLLGYHGIPSVSFDRHPSTAIHPRAALFLLRTVEILRQLGLEDEFRKQSETMFDLDAGMLIVEKLYQGKVIARLQESDPAKVASVTPSARLWLTQNMFEPLLRGEAKRFGSEQRFGQSILHYEEVEDGVIVVVQDVETKLLKKYKVKYLIASDGNRSATREKEDIHWKGPGVISNSISINFKADLTPYLGERAVHGTTYVNNPDVNAGFRLEQKGKAGFMIVTGAKGRETGFEPDSVSEKEARRFFKDASGIEDDIDLEVSSISYWSVAALCADRFTSRKGRVFLMGDAAHVMPPTGGMGGNTGVADAYNLAWKLAFVLKGWSGPSLLKTYDLERPKAAEFMMQQAFARLVKRVLHGKGYECKEELPDITCELGYRYTEGALERSPKESKEFQEVEDPYHPLVLPGSRMPHAVLQSSQNGGSVSTLDLIKQRLVLLAVDTNSPWLEAAKSQDIPMDAYVLNRDSAPYSDPSGSVGSVLKLSEGEALVVRPDGYIAWRADQTTEGHEEKLRRVLESIFAR